MFEKEAEEYGLHQALWCPSESGDLRDAFKEGAEFGYNKAMNEAKGIIKDLLHCLPKENIEGVYEVTVEAEQFLSEVEK